MRWKWVAASANASSVRTCAIAARWRNGHLAEARRERRAVQQVAGVEEEREHDDRQPRQPGRDVADGGELGRAGERDDAHRARLEQGVAASRAASPNTSAKPIAETPRCPRNRGGAACGRPAGRRSPGLPEERLRAGPVADDVDGVELGRVARRRGAGPGSRRWGTSRPTSGPWRRAASTPRPACRRGRRERRRGPRRAPRAPPRSRSCTGSSGRRSRSRAPPRCRRVPAADRCERSLPPARRG